MANMLYLLGCFIPFFEPQTIRSLFFSFHKNKHKLPNSKGPVWPQRFALRGLRARLPDALPAGLHSSECSGEEQQEECLALRQGCEGGKGTLIYVFVFGCLVLGSLVICFWLLVYFGLGSSIDLF